MWSFGSKGFRGNNILIVEEIKPKFEIQLRFIKNKLFEKEMRLKEKIICMASYPIK